VIKITKNGFEIPLAEATTLNFDDTLETNYDSTVRVNYTLKDGSKVQVIVGPLSKFKFTEPCDPFLESQPLASSEHSSVRGTINGGGDFIFILPPLSIGIPILALQPGSECAPDVRCGNWSKCENGVKSAHCFDAGNCTVNGLPLYENQYQQKYCYPQGKLSKIQEKLGCDPYDPFKGVASSEHSSIRGTINGGGDFIFILPPLSIAFPLLDIIPYSYDPGFKFWELSNGQHEIVYNALKEGLVAVQPLGSETKYTIYDNTYTSEILVEVEVGSVRLINSNGDVLDVHAGQSAVANAADLSYYEEPEPGPSICAIALVPLALLGFAFYISRSKQ
jgi:hypothetical protein